MFYDMLPSGWTSNRKEDNMAKVSPYESGNLTDSIFLILLATLKPIHGYRIMQTVQDMTAGEINRKRCAIGAAVFLHFSRLSVLVY